MSKHKNFHGINSRRQYAKAYAAFHRGDPYGSAPQDFLLKKAAPSVTSTESGRAEQNLTGTVSASDDTRETEGKQV